MARSEISTIGLRAIVFGDYRFQCKCHSLQRDVGEKSGRFQLEHSCSAKPPSSISVADNKPHLLGRVLSKVVLKRLL